MSDKKTQFISNDRVVAFWFFAFLLLAFMLYKLSGVLAPFVVGLAVAYFFDPVADFLEEVGLSRGLSACVVIFSFLGLVAAILFLIFPLLKGQVVGLVTRIPQFFELLKKEVEPVFNYFYENFSDSEMTDFQSAANSYAGDILSWFGGFLQDVWIGGLAFFNVLSLIIISPLVAFYLLRDWDKIVKRFDELLPRNTADIFREQLSIIDDTVAAFVRGQASVCLVLGLFYSIALTLVGLDFGLLVGLSTGILAFIPYVGAGIGFVVGTGIAIAQFSDWQTVGLVVVIFVTGQTAESYLLTPKLVGDRVGLHPIWIIFSLLAGGVLFGFTGVLLAVPVTAVIGVLVRFAIETYLKSSLYNSEEINNQ